MLNFQVLAFTVVRTSAVRALTPICDVSMSLASLRTPAGLNYFPTNPFISNLNFAIKSGTVIACVKQLCLVVCDTDLRQK